MKKILVDVGSFYTKVYVMCQVPEKDGVGPLFEFYGRSFFPTLVSRAGDIDKGSIYYEHKGDLYAVGYDCSSVLRLEQIIDAFNREEFNNHKAFVILKKVISDHADNHDDLEICVVVDSYQQAQVFEEIAKELRNKKVESFGFRGYDKRRIKKEVTIRRLDLMSSGEAVAGFLENRKMSFTTALVVDVGYNKTKLYVVDCEEGLELFQVEDCGVSYYYEKIVHLFAEEIINDHHFLWLVKQIELGCEEVDVRREDKGMRMGNGPALSIPSSLHYDISLVMENVRWDLNKEFTRFTTDTLTSYYTNRVEWPTMLMVTGGGASLNGDILRLSLEEDGYCFNEIYIEKRPLYTMLEGAAYMLSMPLS